MFMNNVYKKEEVKTIALQDLRSFGIKCRPKNPKKTVAQKGNKIFNVPLTTLPTQTVTMKNGQQIVIPKIVHEMCSFLMQQVDIEGIFRKDGSKSRQTEIRRLLDAGCSLGDDHHIIDVAVTLKQFLRLLPEPLIPFGYHELFLRCVLLEKNKLQAVLLGCLLLPQDHLNTLYYLLQFFHEVSEHSAFNKMTCYNLAVVIGPNMLPLEEKLSPSPQLRTAKTTELFQLLIENAKMVGMIPENVIERVGSLNTFTEEERKKKKRRSGSLTRMFNGLKKIVGGKSVDDDVQIVTPDLLTPALNRVVKKRKIQSAGISLKKKKEVISKLPENTLLSTPFTPQRTPINMNLNGVGDKKNLNSCDMARSRNLPWFSRSRSVKNLKETDLDSNGARSTAPTKSILERRWSTVNQMCQLKRTKKRNSCVASLQLKTKLPIQQLKQQHQQVIEEKQQEPDYVRVPKTEFEAFINKVTAIERRISNFELENTNTKSSSLDHCTNTSKNNSNNSNNNSDSNKNLDVLKSVQTVYEQTLEHIEPMSPATDQLARRLSKELKIRRSAEQKIIRSPSARKIGSMRRRSREVERNNQKLTRRQSWHAPPKNGDIKPLFINNNNNNNVKDGRNHLKRGQPNTVLTGLPFAARLDYLSDQSGTSFEEKTRKSERISTNLSCNLSGSSTDHWVSAEGYFSLSTSQDNNNVSANSSDRASLAKLRSQNAGMVLAKAKLFDLNTKDCCLEFTSIPRAKLYKPNNNGGTRTPQNVNSNNNNNSNRQSYRSKKKEDNHLKLNGSNKKSMSPRRRNHVSNRHKLYMARHYVESQNNSRESDKENLAELFNNNKSQVTPLKDSNRIGDLSMKSPKYATPQIRKGLNVNKSPKRLCRTPKMQGARCTPLKALATPL